MNLAGKSIWRTTLAACLVLLVCAVRASAADTLDVILVKASDTGTSDAALKPYLSQLAKFGFTSYQTVVRKAVALQAGDVALAQGFKATLGQAEGRRVPVTISRGDENLIRTTVTFSPDHPVVSGTYAADDGSKMIVILVLATP